MGLLNDNIRYLRESTGHNQTEFAYKFGLTRPQVASYEESRAIPKIEVLALIANFFGISIDHMVKYDFQKLNYDGFIKIELDKNGKPEVTFDKKSGVSEPTEPIHLRNNKPTPLVGVEAFGGSLNAIFRIEEKDIQAYYVVPDFTNVDFMIRVKGNSMYPKYSSGDVVACRIIKESKFIQWGKVYIVATKEQGILIKRLQQSEKKNCITAFSENEKTYKPFDIPQDEILGMAIVIGVIRLE